MSAADGEPSPRNSGARALEMLLDYAIVEGAAQRRPFVVLLLRMALLELTRTTQAAQPLHVVASLPAGSE